METTETATLPPPGGIPATGAPGSAPVQSAAKSTPEQRAKWREKRRAQQARKAGLPVSAPAPAPGAALPSAPAVASPALPLAVLAPPVLWSAEHLRPIVSECIPVAEALDLSSLKDAAKAVSPEALALVVEKAKWNPVARTALESSLPACLAKWLNSLGVSAENREEITLAGAVVCIAWGSYSLRQELRAMAEERKKAENKQKETPNAARPDK